MKNLMGLNDKVEINHAKYKDSINLGKKYIVSFGPPGAGKTTILKNLDERSITHSYYCDDILEPTLNFEKYLQYAFVDKRHEFFFNFQLEALQLRFWQSFYATDNSMVDESIFSTLAYSKSLKSLGWLNEHNYETFFYSYCSYESIMTPPYKILYFYCDTNTIIERINKRGRPHEMNYTYEYIDQLNISFKETAIFLKERNHSVEFICTQKKSIDEISNHICKNILTI